MTVGEFSKLIKDNNIPEDARMLSDSGWECDPTDMDGVFYNESKNEIMFTQTGDEYDQYNRYSDWRCIHSYKWTKTEIKIESEIIE